MGASFDDNTAIAEDERGVPFAMIGSAIKRTTAEPVRVQVTQTFVEREWGLSWKDPAAVMQRFDAVKRRHIDAALTAKPLVKSDYCVYTIE